MATWLTAAQVATHGGIDAPAEGGDSALDVWAEAAAEWVQEVGRPDLFPTGFDPDAVPRRIVAGAAMLAWRWYQRRSSPNGVVAMPDFGTAGTITGSDPDIARLLGIDSAGGFVFGAGRILPVDDDTMTTVFP